MEQNKELPRPDRRPTIKDMPTVTSLLEIPKDLLKDLEDADTQRGHEAVDDLNDTEVES
jgi:hypothetical protein